MSENISPQRTAVSALRKADSRFALLLFECVGQHGLEGGAVVYVRLLEGDDLERHLEDAEKKWHQGTNPSARQKGGVVTVFTEWRNLMSAIRDHDLRLEVTSLLISLDFMKAADAGSSSRAAAETTEKGAKEAADLVQKGQAFLNNNAAAIVAAAMIFIVAGMLIDPRLLAFGVSVAGYMLWRKLRPYLQRDEKEEPSKSASSGSKALPVIGLCVLVAIVLFVTTSSTEDSGSEEAGVRVGVEAGTDGAGLKVNTGDVTETPMSTPTPTATSLPTAEAIYLKTATDDIAAVYGRCLTDNFVQLQGYARGTEGGVADDFANVTFDKLSKSDDIVSGLVAQGYSAIQGTVHEVSYSELATLLNGGDGVRGVCEIVSVDLAGAFTGSTREELQANMQKIPGILDQVRPLAAEIQSKAAEAFGLSLPDLPEVDGVALGGVYDNLVVAAQTPTPRPPAPTSPPRQVIITVVAPQPQATSTPNPQVQFPTQTPTQVPPTYTSAPSGSTGPAFCMTGLYFHPSSGGIGPKAVTPSVGCDPNTGGSVNVLVETAIVTVKGTGQLGAGAKFWVVLADGREVVVLERDLRWR